VYKVPEIRNGGLKRPKVTDGDRARTLRTEVMAFNGVEKKRKSTNRQNKVNDERITGGCERKGDNKKPREA